MRASLFDASAMTLRNAVHALNELSAGRKPDSMRVVLGVRALDSLLGPKDCDLALVEASATLNLYLAQGIGPYRTEARRIRAKYLAEAVHRAISGPLPPA